MKEIKIGNMGETALTFHLKGKKHQGVSEFSCTNSLQACWKSQVKQKINLLR